MRRSGQPSTIEMGSGSETDRGITEVIAFILVFATILGSVALLYTTGFQAMSGYQENEQLNNAERGLVSLADNFNDVLRYDGVDRRYGELTLRGGTIRTGGESTTIEVDTDPANSGTGEVQHDLGSLTYEAGSDTIAYEGGGVFRASGGGSVVVKQPPIRCNPGTGSTDGTVIISILKLDHDGERSVQSTDGVGLTISKTEETVRNDGIDPTPNGDVNISIENPDDTPYDNGWERALKRNGWDGDSGEYTCEDVDRVEMQIVTAEIEY